MKFNEKIKNNKGVYTAYAEAFNDQVTTMFNQLNTSTPGQTAREVERLFDIWRSFAGAVSSGLIEFDNELSSTSDASEPEV